MEPNPLLSPTHFPLDAQAANSGIIHSLLHLVFLHKSSGSPVRFPSLFRSFPQFSLVFLFTFSLNTWV